MPVQSVLLRRRKGFSLEDAKEKIKELGFAVMKVDITKKFFRFRQEPPQKFKRFRTKKVKKDIEFVLGFN